MDGVAAVDVPVIDISPLTLWYPGATAARSSGAKVPHQVAGVARRIDRACRELGFFSVVGHGIDPAAFEQLEASAREFFALDEAEKARIGMARGGRAWRGWFPVGGELTSGEPDHKEGIYFGEELPPDDPRVLAGRPLHGPNLFPARPAELRTRVLETITALTGLGAQLMAAVAIGLGLDAGYFAHHLTADPIVLMRIFHYPPAVPGRRWGVREHTDYGLLTLLHQDHTGGLQVHSGGRWVGVEPIPGALVCNLGDMLERMTAGRYRATPHRVSAPGEHRISVPFFFDPGWDARITELPLGDHTPTPATRERWDGLELAELSGTYGDYLTAKVSAVFPALSDRTGMADTGPKTN